MIRIEDNVDAHIAKEPTSGCWLWMRALTTAGYGLFYVRGKAQYAHRFMYEKANGPIPARMVLDHLCRVRACVNPDHLRVLTRGENIIAEGSLSPSGLNKAKANCPRCGSAYSRDGATRRCKPCTAARGRARSITRRASREATV